MENVKEVMLYFSSCMCSVGMLLLTLIPLALATGIEPDVYDQWNTIEEFEEVSSLRKLLINEDWIDENVPIEELDYILVLTRQCSQDFFPSVPTSLVLSIISVESSFNKDLTGFNNDIGLMQVIPAWHRERIEKYIYDEKVDLYDPRLNVMVGMDFLDELISWSKGDISLAVMAYNMGFKNAKRYKDLGKTSYYCDLVLDRMSIIQSYLEGR